VEALKEATQGEHQVNLNQEREEAEAAAAAAAYRSAVRQESQRRAALLRALTAQSERSERGPRSDARFAEQQAREGAERAREVTDGDRDSERRTRVGRTGARS
jgi:hypothetical protein